MDLKPGSRWKSAVCATEVAIVRGPNRPVSLACGDQAMLAHGQAAAGGASAPAPQEMQVQAGKRYVDEETGLEVLCTKAGAGPLSVDGRDLQPKEAKRLPASD